MANVPIYPPIVDTEDRPITAEDLAWWAAQNSKSQAVVPQGPPRDESGRRDDELDVPLLERITSQALQYEALDNDFGDLLAEHLYELARLVGLVTQARTVGQYRDRIATLEKEAVR